MKKILLLLTALLLFTVSPKAIADEKAEVLKAFNTYVKTANNYDESIKNMYSPNAKIIRQVVKPDGTLVNATTNMETYLKQMKLSQSVAKMKNYKNFYSNVNIEQVGNNYKVSALRQPSGENYKLKTYQVWQNKSNDKWIIIEELMQTKQQVFLKYADK